MTTTPKAFTNPEALGEFLDARWEMTPRVRVRLAEQIAELTVQDVLERLVYQLTEDYFDSDGEGGDGEYGGAWIEVGGLLVINGQRRVQLREVDTADKATA